MKNIVSSKDSKLFNDILTSENKLNLSSKPKAIIDLHQINSVPISPIEQFLVNSMNDITNSPLIFSIQENYVAEVQDKVKPFSFTNSSNSVSDFFPKFLNFNMSDFLKETNSPNVNTSAVFKQFNSKKQIPNPSIYKRNNLN